MVAKAGMPYAENAIAQYLTKQIDALRGQKSQREIALEMGYDKPNVVSMFKRGEMKVPLDKVPALAKALHVDPAHLFRMALEQYWPDQREVLYKVFGTIVTEEERKVLDLMREFTDNQVKLTPELEEALRSVYNKPIYSEEEKKAIANLKL